MNLHEINIVPVDEHIKTHPEIFFGPDGVSARAIVNAIQKGAELLGATKTKTEERDGWWYVCADLDWLENNSQPDITSDNIFDRLCAFPELGENACRAEIMVRIYSDAAFTLKDGNITRVMGKSLQTNTICSQVDFLGSWKRIIGFKYNSIA